MQNELDLHRVPDDQLVRRLGELVSSSRRVEADLVAHIGEVEARRLYAREASPSMFWYCTRRLHLSEAEAYLRITVARAARRHEGLLDMLRDGRLHLRGIALLAPLLTRENREAILARAKHRSRREIEELVAELQPRPDVPARVRRLPRRPASVTGSTPPQGVMPPASSNANSAHQERAGERADEEPLDAAPRGAEAVNVSEPLSPGSSPGSGSVPAADTDGGETVEGSARRESSPGGELCPGRVPRSESKHASSVVPLSLSRYRVQFTASAELHDKLLRLRAVMRSEVPDGDLAMIIDRAISEKLARLEARRFGRTDAPRKTLVEISTRPVSRHVPAAVRRAVVERDGVRCHYVDAQGRRCPEQHRLEFHPRHPFGLGGDHSPGNVSMLCRVHNELLAERDYGRKALERRRQTQARSSPPAVPVVQDERPRDGGPECETSARR